MKKEKGITLIALIVTIIVLLILAAIGIGALVGENGILRKANKAREETIKNQLKEEIELALLDIQIEQVRNGSQLTFEAIKDQLPYLLENITAQIEATEIIGEYQEYEYTINDQFQVTIGGNAKGIKINYRLSNEDFTNQDIHLSILVTSTNGTITSIEGPTDLVKNDDETYLITKNGSYEFTAKDSSGELKKQSIRISNIDKIAPKDFTLQIIKVEPDGFTLVANVDDEEETVDNAKSGIARYEYYIKNIQDSNFIKYESTNNTYKVTNLDFGTEYVIYGIAYDKAGNAKKTEEVKQFTEAETKNIYIDKNQGNDTTGEGTQENPYATLGKISEQGLITPKLKYNIYLGKGNYTLPESIFKLNCDQSINIQGDKEKTILTVNQLFPNSGGGSRNYQVNFYRLVWKSTTAVTNAINVATPMNFYNIYFDISFNGASYSYFCTANTTFQFINCTLPKKVNLFLRSYTGLNPKPNGNIYLTNCYGGFTASTWGINSDWDFKTNYLTQTPQVDGTSYRITESENVWKDVGTGSDLDGSQADLGVYGGEYSWEK